MDNIHELNGSVHELPDTVRKLPGTVQCTCINWYCTVYMY